jgi:hypothetical protein
VAIYEQTSTQKQEEAASTPAADMQDHTNKF